MKVPPEIIEQLKEAAEFNLVTALENISSQINQLGDEYHPLSKRLQHLIRSFDISKIKEIAEGLSSE
jgi:archaellum component FlaC